jgi:hypothetical protein
MTSPNPAVRSPGTFSTTTTRGRRTRTARANSNQSPERVPTATPARRPAWETSWQGKPPASTSTDSRCRSTSRTSGTTRRSGACRSMTARQCRSDSHAQTVRKPARSSPRSSPRQPENSDPTFTRPRPRCRVAGEAGSPARTTAPAARRQARAAPTWLSLGSARPVSISDKVPRETPVRSSASPSDIAWSSLS